GGDVSESEKLSLEIMDTRSASFKQLIKAHAARQSEFFYHQHHHVDLCQMPVPVRRAMKTDQDSADD
ncbi:MAG: hypothetical protein AAF986_06150, partial [Pseudomonadota bacterium]